MHIRTLSLALVVAVASASAAWPQGRPRPIEDPNAATAKVVERIEQGDMEGLARMLGLTMGLDTSDGQMENQIKQIALMGKPMFFDRVHDRTLGRSLQQMIYYAPFRNERNQINFAFFNFVFMRGNEGWYFTQFQFKLSPAHLIPPGWITHDAPAGQ
jgi:hypothetical protein